MHRVIGQVVHVPGVGAVDNVHLLRRVFPVLPRLLRPVPQVLVEALAVEGPGIVALSGHGAEGGGFAAFYCSCHGSILSQYIAYHHTPRPYCRFLLSYA